MHKRTSRGGGVHRDVAASLFLAPRRAKAGVGLHNVVLSRRERKKRCLFQIRPRLHSDQVVVQSKDSSTAPHTTSNPGPPTDSAARIRPGPNRHCFVTSLPELERLCG